MRRLMGFRFPAKAIVPTSVAKTTWSAVAADAAFLPFPLGRMNRRRKAASAATALQGPAVIDRRYNQAKLTHYRAIGSVSV